MPDSTDSVEWQSLSSASFEIGGEDQLSKLRLDFPAKPEDPDDRKRLGRAWSELQKELRIRIGTLLKADNVSILLGAGASKDAGGPLLGSIPAEVERRLLDEGVSDGVAAPWLRALFLAAGAVAAPEVVVPHDEEAIVLRHDAGTEDALPVNLEEVLSRLFSWERAFPKEDVELHLAGLDQPAVRAGDVAECRRRTVGALVAQCILPARTDDTDPLLAHRELVKKLLTRPLSLKRVNVFTVNYDTLLEQAADAEGAILIDGFVGTVGRVFRPESYDYDLYFPAETTEGRVHRLDRVLHLFKLHGSVTWRETDPSWQNPFGLTAVEDPLDGADSAVIYPSPAKYGETLGMPYAELFRRFAQAIVRPQSTLVAVGYGFGDEHVNAIIRQALGVPSFSLVVVDPGPSSAFVSTLRSRGDRRVWILSGVTFGTAKEFIARALPDLRDEEIARRVIDTYRSLGDDVNQGR